jgi:hypothetical protein
MDSTASSGSQNYYLKAISAIVFLVCEKTCRFLFVFKDKHSTTSRGVPPGVRIDDRAGAPLTADAGPLLLATACRAG